MKKGTHLRRISVTIGETVRASLHAAAETSQDVVTTSSNAIHNVLHYDQAPSWMRNDPYIKHGYRSQSTSCHSSRLCIGDGASGVGFIGERVRGACGAVRQFLVFRESVCKLLASLNLFFVHIDVPLNSRLSLSKGIEPIAMTNWCFLR